MNWHLHLGVIVISVAAFWAFIQAHQTTTALIAFWLGTNVVTALPSPTQSSGNFYKFFFSLMHGLGGSLSRVFPALRLPPVPSDPTPANQQPTFFAPPVNSPEVPKP
jgi:hypothetical protein